MAEGTEKYSVLGKSLPLIDAHEKVTGQLKYAGDIVIPGMLHAKILRSPYPHARISEIDTTKAERLPGVHAVITHKNIPDKEWSGIWSNRQGKVMDEVVRYVGDEVAAVAADSETIAEEAINHIEVRYEQLPAVFDIEEAMKPDAPEVRAGGNAQRRSNIRWGDVKKGFRESEFIVEHRTTMGYQQHSPLDRNACIVSWSDNRLIVWTATQTMFNLRDNLAAYFEIPPSYVRVIQVPAGGSFGLWWDLNFQLITALLAKQVRRPVRLELRREEVLTTTKRREHPISYVKFGCNKDGKLVAARYRHLFDNGAYGFKADPYQSATDIYPVPNGEYEAIGVNTNLGTAGCMRGVGDLTLSYAIEQTIDMVAEKFNMDPLEFRLNNHFRTGDVLPSAHEVYLFHATFPDRPVPVVRLSSCGLDECLRKGAKLIGWEEKWKGWGKPVASDGTRTRGIGVAISTHICGASWFGSAGAIVKVNADGKVDFIFGSGRMGQGSDTTQAQIVAEVLGIPLKDVVVPQADSLYTPQAPSTVGSVTAYMMSPVTKAAAEDAKQKILEIAAMWLEVKADELDIKDRRIFVKADPERGMSLVECLSRPTYETLSSPTIVSSASSLGFPFEKPAKMNMAGFAEVEVNTETGIVKVVDYAQVHDSGTLMNPAVMDNQASGGAYMAASFALGETLIYDEDGKVLTPNFLDYKIFGLLDLPFPKIDFVELYEPNGVFGIKGIGEGATCVAASAIASAVYNAIGVRVDPPLRPDRILEALKEKGTKTNSSQFLFLVQ
jgi:xanthine dehydrogenase molybdenum-binding subunit